MHRLSVLSLLIWSTVQVGDCLCCSDAYVCEVWFMRTGSEDSGGGTRVEACSRCAYFM